MVLAATVKAQIVKPFRRSSNDTGSPEVQIALLTARINNLTEHLKIHQHDFHTRYGLTKLVSQRRKLMRYLKRKDLERYQIVVKDLDIRDIRD
ncbi:MAG: 30S ribosomal protein S15 [Gammaproteobacteria bacterium RIFCSPHIGHO2_12_FULL_37_14]|nr:MAG: 30S ribosomal protein S15 [Gammaproteobacteria bacterium RIFCSPHIGHO2_12_FULL_37_14]